MAVLLSKSRSVKFAGKVIGVYLLELSRYIHLNPVRVGDVSRPWEFPWSSAAAYVGLASVPDFLTVSEVLGRFGRRRTLARRRYAEFLEDKASFTGAKPWERVEGQVLLGEPQWVERMRRFLEGRPLPEEVVAVKALRPHVPLSVVITRVCRAARLNRETLLRPRGGRGSWARAIAMALAWEECGLEQKEIGREFGVGAHAVSKAIARAGALRGVGGRLGREIKRLNSTFKG